MPREITAKLVEEMASRIAEIDRSLTENDEAIKDAQVMDRVFGWRRALSFILGVPCGLVAFFFLGFYYPFHGRGLALGIGLAVATFVISRIGLSTPAYQMPNLESQQRSLLSQRKKMQTQIQAYAENETEAAAEEAV